MIDGEMIVSKVFGYYIWRVKYGGLMRRMEFYLYFMIGKVYKL